MTIPATVKVDANPTSSRGYYLLLKLDAPNAFQSTKTIILDSGPYTGQQAIVIRPSKPFEEEAPPPANKPSSSSSPSAGQQAIVIRPSKPFDFLELPDKALNSVYRFYFASAGSTTDGINLDGKRTSNREIYAKTYDHLLW
ncbi:unnamed protein product [Zymoseptoria tritici ST99CH_3D7]|uniref:Uncharacterized protein n=1 Tax=Zymoseptoria tritici (strain ST99CH_3D7) TaxID=1276538 RepID=A0A1X7RD39_ZYMT9|nr:unnamed protein product [Zymoseptoria tritici ST99CH_3D7]